MSGFSEGQIGFIILFGMFLLMLICCRILCEGKNEAIYSGKFSIDIKSISLLRNLNLAPVVITSETHQAPNGTFTSPIPGQIYTSAQVTPQQG